MKNLTVAKFDLASTLCRNNLKTLGNMTVKTLCKTLMPKKCIYILRIDHSHSKSVEKCSVYIILEFSHDAVSKCAGESSVFKIYRFQNLPTKMCRFRVNGRPIRHIFHRFQNLPASCEHSLNTLHDWLVDRIRLIESWALGNVE